MCFGFISSKVLTWLMAVFPVGFVMYGGTRCFEKAPDTDSAALHKDDGDDGHSDLDATGTANAQANQVDTTLRV